MTLTRRLLAGVASLVLAAGGAVALGSTPALAGGDDKPRVTFTDKCEGTTVKVFSGDEDRYWTVEAGGTKYLNNEKVKEDRSKEVFVPAGAGEITVFYRNSKTGNKQGHKYHKWEPKPECVEKPGETPPTCENPKGTITIPASAPYNVFYTLDGEEVGLGTPHELDPGTYTVKAFFTKKPGDIKFLKQWTITFEEPKECPKPDDPKEEPELPEVPEPEVTQPTCETEGSITFPVQTPMGIFYRLNGEDVELGSTHTLAPGTHTVEAFLPPIAIATTETGSGEDLEPIKVWTITIEEPDCPGDGGGELPKTGSPVMFLVGGAAALLVIGGGLFLMARRRQVRFTS